MEGKKVVTKKDIQTRLRRIEGQIKGIEKMVESDSCCKDILIQVAAVRAATNKVGGIILENYAKTCFLGKDNEKSESEKIEDLVSTLTMFLK
jgi:DNA-binding FrmR family transcriptional regulator